MENKIPQCPIYKKCSSCQLQNLTYDKQLAFKQGKAVSALGKYCHVSDICGMYYPLHYRNKLSASFEMRRGRVISGIWQSSSGKIVKTDGCMIEDKLSSDIVKTICRLANKLDIPAYDRYSGVGFLRNVLIRRGFKTSQILVNIVSNGPIFPRRAQFIDELISAHPEITTITHSQNSSDTEILHGGRERVLYGDGYITDKLLGCTFKITSSAFYQINPAQTEKLYSKAITLASLTGNETVIDAYCGVGTIGICAAKSARKVISVETNGDAVRCAIDNAHLNGAKNVRVYRADATQFLSDMAQSGDKCDVIFMDPPRAGASREFIEAAAHVGAKRIVYVSCNVETQSRDVALFESLGYTAKSAYPYDMFPFTNHVECVVLMSRIEK